MSRPSPHGAVIDPNGKFLQECGLTSERRSDDVFPAHPNGTQLSRDRFFIVYATRGWRGIDEDRSIVSFGWSEPGHFGGNRLAAVRHRYNRQRHRYEWVQTGPPLFYPHFPAIEASPIRWRDGFVLAARSYPHNQGANFLRLDDPFAPAAAGAGASTVQLPASGPATAYACPDGVVRLFSGMPGRGRNPLYCTVVDPDDGFAVRDRVTVIDLLASGLPLRRKARPVADMTKLLPHAGGRSGLVVHRVRTGAINYAANTPTAVNAAEKAIHGVYAALIRYREDYPGIWDFA